MRFEWDESKNQINIQKHNVSFEEAETVFYDVDALYEYDESHSDVEERFRIIGLSSHNRILIVCHCFRYKDAIRIISARPLKDYEIRFYKNKLGGNYD